MIDLLAPHAGDSTGVFPAFELRRKSLSTIDPALELVDERVLLRRAPTSGELLNGLTRPGFHSRLAAFSASPSIFALNSASLPEMNVRNYPPMHYLSTALTNVSSAANTVAPLPLEIICHIHISHVTPVKQRYFARGSLD